MAEWPVPDTPEELAAWALDEMTIQIEQAQDHPSEATDRIPFAGEMAFLVSVLLWNGALPAHLPWEQAGGENASGEAIKVLTGFGIFASPPNGHRHTNVGERQNG